MTEVKVRPLPRICGRCGEEFRQYGYQVVGDYGPVCRRCFMELKAEGKT